MHREDNSKYLLYIEPKAIDKLKEPINDELVEIMELALSKAKVGVASYSKLEDMGDVYEFEWNDPKNGTQKRLVPSFSEDGAYRGSHRTECGERSSNKDYLLENGMITNSLAPFYLKWYRFAISESEMRKVEQLVNFYKK
jgi:hypothetical protein